MRKTLLLLTLAATLSSNAQLEVNSKGQTLAGNPSMSETSSTPVRYDTGAAINVFGLDEAAGGYISFGDANKVSVGEWHGDSDQLGLRGSKGLLYSADLANALASKMVFSYTSASDAFIFNCPVSATNILTSSDARLKTDVASLDDSWRGLSDLNSVSYRILIPADSVATGDGVASKDSRANSGTAEGVDHGISYGFIAQEVQKIYPDLVHADENGMLAIDYTGFIPLLVDAVKNLSAKVAEQEETIATLANPAGPSRKAASVGGVEAEKIALMQNRPNPFNVATTIECTLPESVGNAFLCVYDLQGKQVGRIDLTERGRVSTVIDASTLQPGMYIYALIADGTEIDSKRMILTD